MACALLFLPAFSGCAALVRSRYLAPESGRAVGREGSAFYVQSILRSQLHVFGLLIPLIPFRKSYPVSEFLIRAQGKGAACPAILAGPDTLRSAGTAGPEGLECRYRIRTEALREFRILAEDTVHVVRLKDEIFWSYTPVATH